MLDSTKTQSDGRNTEGALQQDGYASMGPWTWFRYILSKKSLQLQKGRRMVTAWTKEALENL